MRLEGCCAVAGRTGLQYSTISVHLLLLWLAVLQLQGGLSPCSRLCVRRAAHVTDMVNAFRRVGHPERHSSALGRTQGPEIHGECGFAAGCQHHSLTFHTGHQPAACGCCAQPPWAGADTWKGEVCVGSNPSSWERVTCYAGRAVQVDLRAVGASGTPRRLRSPDRAHRPPSHTEECLR